MGVRCRVSRPRSNGAISVAGPPVKKRHYGSRQILGAIVVPIMVLLLGLIRWVHVLSSAPTSAVHLTTSSVVLVFSSSKVQEGHRSPFTPFVVGCGGLLPTGKPSAPLVFYLTMVQQDNAGLAIRASTEMVWVPPSCPFIQCKSLAVVPVPITHDPWFLVERRLVVWSSTAVMAWVPFALVSKCTSLAEVPTK
jgi:hypothetical protein